MLCCAQTLRWMATLPAGARGPLVPCWQDLAASLGALGAAHSGHGMLERLADLARSVENAVASPADP